MKAYMKFNWLVAAAALTGLMASDAHAGTCETQVRPVPTSGSEVITLACEHLTVGAAGGNFTARSTKQFSALKTSGPSGTSIQILGLDNFGNPIAGCQATDPNLNEFPTSVTCAAAVRFKGIVTFAE